MSYNRGVKANPVPRHILEEAEKRAMQHAIEEDRYRDTAGCSMEAECVAQETVLSISQETLSIQMQTNEFLQQIIEMLEGPVPTDPSTGEKLVGISVVQIQEANRQLSYRIRGQVERLRGRLF